MIDQILQNFQRSTYDFRSQANLSDPLGHLFPNWVPYYRMKAAIAEALQPKRILEIGVRYGYSGLAFLHGCPTAHYTGIDLDAESFGGTKGALDWARQHLPKAQCELILADSQAMERFPGGQYDLIHVDGQQDGDGTTHDLELAIRQGRHILVDGYFWTQHNFRAASEFLLQHKSAIDYFFVIPGYAGELFIKVRESTLAAPAGPRDSGAVRQAYDASYYLNDCGGWDLFAAARNGALADVRLRSVFDLAMLRQPRRVLDLGCGRGELACQAAAQGCEVVAVDYSADAIEIARASLAETRPELRDRVTLHCADASQVSLDQPVDVAIAGDLIEHMAPAELDRLYAAVARQLTPQGLFVVHTFPNKWLYDYDYPRRRRVAAGVGAYLPPNPRTHFERLMHINEQSPPRLRRQLQRHFPHVLLWFSNVGDPAGTLGKTHPPRQLAAHRDLFALASLQPIDPAEVLGLFRTDALPPAEIAGISLESRQPPLRLAANSSATLAIRLHNKSGRTLNSFSPRPVHFAYHLLRAGDRSMALFEGKRSRLTPAASPGSAWIYHPTFSAPAEPGEYILQVTLVQESVCWFGPAHGAALVEIGVTVT